MCIRDSYVVDVDIKGFFDNVDHGKLLKQLWTMGIRDKRPVSYTHLDVYKRQAMN